MDLEELIARLDRCEKRIAVLEELVKTPLGKLPPTPSLVTSLRPIDEAAGVERDTAGLPSALRFQAPSRKKRGK